MSEAARRFGAGSGDPADLGGFESLVLGTHIRGTPAVIRIGHGRRRPPPLVAAELHWLEYLAAAGIGVARPLRSAAGALVETVAFDDCCYSWLADDLAVVLFYALSWAEPGREGEHLATFWPVLAGGYRAEQPITPPWLAEIPVFMKLREIDTYAVIHRSMDVERIEDPWAAWFMNGRRERIAAGRPVVEIGFEAPWR